VINSLPGNDLIFAGIEDLQSRRETIPALLVAIGAPKLRSLGLEVPQNLPSNPEHRLYDLLSATDPDSAHSKYNALIRKLVSFERALQLLRKVTAEGLCTKSFKDAIDAASPPDVRRGSASPFKSRFQWAVPLVRA
jgi:hypothetical protein